MKAMNRLRGVQVWPAWVRLLHWVLGALVLASWLTHHGGGSWHEWLGYGAAVAVMVRVVAGGIADGHARFDAFVVRPRAVLAHARELLAGKAPRFVGHNPLGGYMVLLLLGATTIACATGWLYTTDRYWGVEWVERLHSRASDALLLLVALHVCGVLFESARVRENLIAAMLHGRKLHGRKRSADDPNAGMPQERST